jgi:hypothetical protein
MVHASNHEFHAIYLQSQKTQDKGQFKKGQFKKGQFKQDCKGMPLHATRHPSNAIFKFAFICKGKGGLNPAIIL